MTAGRHVGSMNLNWMHKMNTDLRLTFLNSWHPLALEPIRILLHWNNTLEKKTYL